MGLCKCPKRKVTNLFCFEHRVNVCENCLVSNHSKCIVKSYLQWLQDSDYSPHCTLCNQSLNSNETDVECIRLACYDVFHWQCLNHFARSLPANTAPAGYTCPTCKMCIFPPNNLVSPVAEAVKAKLSQVNWARAGLGLPLIDEPDVPDSSGQSPSVVKADSSPRAEASLATASPAPAPLASTANTTRPSAQVSPYTATPTGPQSQGHSVISVDAGATSRGTTGFGDPRKLFDTTKDDDIFNLSHDHDEDKYKRRPAFSWLARWFKSIEGKKKRDPHLVRKRFFMVLIIGVIAFITLVVVLSKLGREAADHDPFLDPMANPNIRVQEKNIIVA